MSDGELFDGGMVHRRGGKFKHYSDYSGGNHTYEDDYSGGMTIPPMVYTVVEGPFTLLNMASSSLGAKVMPYKMIFSAVMWVLLILILYFMFKKPAGKSSGKAHSSASKKKKKSGDEDYEGNEDINPRYLTEKTGFMSGAFDVPVTGLNGFMSGFFGGSSDPVYTEAPNNIVRSEDREREAVMALSKINQERQRRMATGEVLGPATSWDKFWPDWQSTHPQDGDGIVLPDEIGDIEAGMY